MKAFNLLCHKTTILTFELRCEQSTYVFHLFAFSSNNRYPSQHSHPQPQSHPQPHSHFQIIKNSRSQIALSLSQIPMPFPKTFKRVHGLAPFAMSNFSTTWLERRYGVSKNIKDWLQHKTECVGSKEPNIWEDRSEYKMSILSCGTSLTSSTVDHPP